MSSFGQYVHYSWANYKLAGTYQSELGWRDQKSDAYRSQPRNFHSNIFREHRTNLLAYLHKQYSVPNLKALEERYNKNNNEMLTQLQNLWKKNKNSANTGIISLLSLVQKNWSALDIQEIMSHLKINKQGMFYYDGKGLSGKDTTTEKMKLFFDIEAGHAIYLAPLQKKCASFRETILASEELDTLSKQAYLEKLNNVMYTLDLLSKKQQISDTILKQLSNTPHPATTKNASAHGKLSNFTDATVEKFLITPLQELSALFNTRAQINHALSHRLPEILGDLIAKKANGTAAETIEDWLRQLKISGTTGTTMTISGEKIHDDMFFSNFDTSVLSGAAKKIVIEEDGVTETVTFRSVGGAVQQKTDIIFEGTHNISMKNTDMSATFSTDQFITPKISLQSSSLYLFLAGIQHSQENLGTHYLNILAQHPDTDNLYTKMRQDATRSLSLYLLYSALTGEGQLRKGKNAQIFAIYDKGTLKKGVPRVRFYSMWDILNKVDAFKTGALFSPSIETLSLSNDLVDNNSGYSRKAANIRISKLLVEARNKTISISLSKQFLNNIY